MTQKKIVVVGARGYVGKELLPLLETHPQLEVKAVGSRMLAGESVKKHIQKYKGSLSFSSLTPEALAQSDADLVFLALPNGESPKYLTQLQTVQNPMKIIDLSADHRFDSEWQYGLVEHQMDNIKNKQKISNPGCYATGAQMAIRPFPLRAGNAPHLGFQDLVVPGRRASKNDPEVLYENILPYALSDHIHEKEIGHHLSTPVRFMPHVAFFFRGIMLTINIPVKEKIGAIEAHIGVVNLMRSPFDSGARNATMGARQCFETPLVYWRFQTNEAGNMCVVATLDNLSKGQPPSITKPNLPLAGKQIQGFHNSALWQKNTTSIDDTLQDFMAGEDVVLDKNYYF